MPAGDVWIFGAGASADDGAPMIRDFKAAAQRSAATSHGEGREALEAVLDFWKNRLDTLDIEQLFGFLDSKDLALATGEVEATGLQRKTLYLIAKVLADSLRGRVSPYYTSFVEKLEDFVPVITLNWDILLEEAMLGQKRKIDYMIAGEPPWDPDRRWRRAQRVFKLHGSLNWIRCGKCLRLTFEREKVPIATFLLSGEGRQCQHCGERKDLSVLMVPPVLSKLTGDPVVRGIWTEAYKVLKDATRVHIVGYSFPPTDLQTRLFIQKGLGEASKLERIYVITRPKFGTERVRFEDRYVDALGGGRVGAKVEFVWKTFSDYCLGR